MKPYFADESVTLYHGDALAVLRELPDASVDCCVTSPPYYGLRDYGEPGQYGLEATPAAYVETMREVFAEVRRVVADDGTLWLNIGDSYSTRWSSVRSAGGGRGARTDVRGRSGVNGSGLADKNLLGVPWRLAFALQDDGWYLRSEIIWAKRNMMPDPAKDRPSSAHEHVFLLAKRSRYYFDAEAIREDSDPEQEEHNRRYARQYEAHTARAAHTGVPGAQNNVGVHSRPGAGGRTSRDVWWISAQPFPGAHFAVMPPELARRCIAAGTQPGAVVLDPFCGSGTTGMVANRQGRRFVGIDLSAKFLDLALRTRLAQAPLIGEVG